MKNITINTHDCSQEEFEDLKGYLENNCWDFKEESDSTESVDEKSALIIEIKKIVSDIGIFGVTDLDDSSICIDQLDSCREVIEYYNEDGVEVFKYKSGHELGSDHLDYDELSTVVLVLVLEQVKRYQKEKS